MKSKFIPLTVMEVVDMLISGKERMAIDIVNEFFSYSEGRVKHKRMQKQA